MPLERLKDTTEGRLRLTAIQRAGYLTVGAAAQAGVHRLQLLDGVGPQTASRVVAAANQVESALQQSVRVRFDVDRKPPAHAALLGALYAYSRAASAVASVRAEATDLAVQVDGLIDEAAAGASRLRMFFSGSRRKAQAAQALAKLDTLMSSGELADLRGRVQSVTAQLAEPIPEPGKLWQAYEERPVAYNGLLIEVGQLAPDVQASHGYLPSDLAARVMRHPLDTSQLHVSLRGYQAFGARFALTQRRTILGDEMGLGKTIEALAAMCHLRSEGRTHFLVVCPASVLANWIHEVRRHTELLPHRLHGVDRAANYQAWLRRGGIAVTTYDALRSLAHPTSERLAMVVVDEAHYVKNPTAERTKAVRSWAGITDNVLFMTGTPMENRVEEFRSLVGHIRPDIAARVRAMDGVVGPARFREAVAPVYLRRNQANVLDELPPRIESQEWVDLEGPSLEAYRTAVASGNFMAMRRAAFELGTVQGSAKLARLVEIVHEAAANGRKTVVFSYFLAVLQTVTQALGELAVGPLTGSVPPLKRQALVDEFSARTGPAVLVSQIQAGGVGLNVQAASVVVITEPQWKPTIEEQAIARCHRMGQVRTVDVYRLLAEDSVDERMLEILATKAFLFDEYARRSQLAESSPDAVDVSDLAAAQEAATQAESERRIIELERKRLRIDAQDSSHSASA